LEKRTKALNDCPVAVMSSRIVTRFCIVVESSHSYTGVNKFINYLETPYAFST
jgi:hypothetical protein